VRRPAPVVLAVIAVVVALLVTTGGDENPYTVKLRLANAQGLREGSPIVIGGVPIGTVKLDATQRDVEVRLEIDDKYTPVGRDATAAVIAQNVLGQKQVRIQPGNTSDAAPDGYTLPTSQIIETADLDQLLATLDPDTRTRLAVLINETGTAFAGRKLDFKDFVEDLAPALSSGADVLGQLTRENNALTGLLDSSVHFVAAITPQRRKIGRMFDVLGATTETIAARRSELRTTLHRAPAALRSARSFLAELRATAGPLATTGRQLSAAARPLQTALDRLEPFRRAAAPALVAARRSAAPSVYRLGKDTTDDLFRTVTTARRLAPLAQSEVPPVGRALDKSMDNLLAVLENWSRAIQFRDRLGHVFRGEATIAPDLYESVLRRLVKRLGLEPPKRERRPKRTRRPVDRLIPKPSGTAPAPARQPKPSLSPEALRKTLDDVLESLPLPLPGKPQAPKSSSRGNDDLTSLLDYLLR